MTSYRVVDRSGGRSLLDRISGKQKQKSVREVAEEVRAAALQVECYFQTTAVVIQKSSMSPSYHSKI